MIEAASLPDEDAGVVCFGDRTVPAAWWDQFRLLFDTDRKRPFKPKAPSPANFAACQETIAAGLALFERADPMSVLWAELNVARRRGNALSFSEVEEIAEARATAPVTPP